MRLAKFLPLWLFFAPCLCWGATSSEFQNATKLLSAARRGDIQTVQVLINSGVDVNYVDSTGVSLVCTAVMNNDVRAIQVLQMYGADASDCERQIKDYKQKTKQAATGDEYGFFSGLSSSHTLVLAAIGVAGVIGGVALLTDVFDKDNNNPTSSSGGGGGGGSGGGGNSGTVWFTVPYGPAYINPDTGVVNTGFDLRGALTLWDTGGNSSYFNYLRKSHSPNFESDGLNSELQNYLLTMGGYYSLASGYLGQNTFRDSASRAPVLSVSGKQSNPTRVALVLGNGINPAGSAGFGDPIGYAETRGTDALLYVDKYVNNTLNTANWARTEQSLFDFSGSGTVFNPFANVNDSALAKIVGGWEAAGTAADDLYGFVPNGQLAIYRTGNGYVWNTLDESARTPVGTFTDNTATHDGILSAGDTITIGGHDYTVYTASSLAVDSEITIEEVKYKLASNSNMFIAKCADTDCNDFAIYVGTDGAWYIKNVWDETNLYDIDTVYVLDGTDILTYKEKVSAPYKNFMAMQNAVGKVDVIANTNILNASRENDYITVDTFKKAAALAGQSDLKEFYSSSIDTNYNNSVVSGGQGDAAEQLFGLYSSGGSTKPMLIMPAGEYSLMGTAPTNLQTPTATFENYAPLLYSGLNHNFMTVVAVKHDVGTTAADTIEAYSNGISSQYGKLNLSVWGSGGNFYQSRRCGIAGTGNNGATDPWCFAAAGPTPEMATASAAGAVASLKSAFDYMDNNQIFTLMALTADGPYLATQTTPLETTTTNFTQKTLAQYLDSMYDIPLEYNLPASFAENSPAEYLEIFKAVYGYGLINLERAIRPGRSVSYYVDGHIVSSPYNAYWRTGTSVHASSVLSLAGKDTITTSVYDVLQSVDGQMSLPRVWKNTISMNDVAHYGLYMGDVLGDFDIRTNKNQSHKIGNFEFNMSMSSREYSDNMNGLDNLRVAFVNGDFSFGAEYQRYLTDGQSRFDGRANGLLALAANAISSDAEYKFGNFGFGFRAFNGAITDETLVEKDPVVSSQYEPGRLGFVNGGAIETTYNNDKFAFDLSFGIVNETNTVLGMYSDGLLSMNGGKTQYLDAAAQYEPMENVKLSLRGTYAKTTVDEFGGIISELSDIKSNAFAFGLDVGGFGLTVAMPLAVIDGNMGYSYADIDVVESNGRYEVAINNPHVEYVDLVPRHRELRFTTSYRKSFGSMTDAGVEFMYRLNPNNIDTFGNESVLMLKIHHRIGI